MAGARWSKIQGGITIGQTGSENGCIVADEEYKSSCRITLEKDCRGIPYGITCGIYGLMVHTTYAGDEGEATQMYEEMKVDLQLFIDSDGGGEAVWCERFTNKW